LFFAVLGGPRKPGNTYKSVIPTETDYGHLLLVKILLFLVMLALATVNRLWLTPALTANARRALRQPRRNVVIEIGAGAAILSLVAVLGVTPPGRRSPLRLL
jgi:putative copper export protein